MTDQGPKAFAIWWRSDDGRELRLATAGMVMSLVGLGLAASGLGLIIDGYVDAATILWSTTLVAVGALLLGAGVAALRHRYLPFVLVSLAIAIGLGLYALSQDAGNWTLLVGALALAGLVVSSKAAFASSHVG